MRPEGGGVVAGAVGLRPQVAVAGDVRVDDAGVAPADRLIVEAELFQDALAGVGDHDVGLRDQLLQNLPPLGGAQVQGDAALVGVGDVKERVFVVRGRHLQLRPEGAPVVALRRLDLDDVRAPVREHAAAGRRGDKACPLDDFETFQWLECAHTVPSFMFILSCCDPAPRGRGRTARPQTGRIASMPCYYFTGCARSRQRRRKKKLRFPQSRPRAAPDRHGRRCVRFPSPRLYPRPSAAKKCVTTRMFHVKHFETFRSRAVTEDASITNPRAGFLPSFA